jgi:hypothetical protein
MLTPACEAGPQRYVIELTDSVIPLDPDDGTMRWHYQ